MKHARLFVAALALACASEDGVANPPSGSGGSAGSGTGGSAGAAGAGGGPSCEPSAPREGSHAVLAKDVAVTSSHSQRTLAIAFDEAAQAFALANVIEIGGNFPLELRKATAGSGGLVVGDPVLVLDATAPSVTNTFDPALAAAREASRVLLVWADDRLGNGNGKLEIFGQFFELGGAVPQAVGANFSISQQPATDEWRPEVTFDPVEKQFWVAWADDRSFAASPGARHEYARSVGLDGALGAELVLGDGTTWQDGVHAAVGGGGPLFVWSEFSDAGAFGRYRARLGAGTLIDLHQSNTLSPAPPAVAWDPVRCRFLVAWQETASADAVDKQVWAALLGPDGSVVKPRFRITEHPAGAGSPHLAFSSATRSFLLTFGSWTDSDARVVELDGEGMPVAPPESLHVTAPTNGTYHHEIAAGGDFVVAITNEDYLRLEATLLGRE